ncbi:CheR family methyltransferase [Vreelandella sp. EE27]
MSSYAPFKRLVYEHYGLRLDGLAEPRLVKAVEALHAATGETDSAALAGRLRQESALFDTFISQLTINETYFYREPEALDWLASHYLPALLAEKTPPLRILSAGCSSGEEPYSLAMALLERFGERAKTLFHIIGGDVDHQVLARARRGIYAGLAFRALPKALKRRYFTARGRHYVIDASLRGWVGFCTFNVLEEHADAAPFDVILFRNVSIYFDHKTRGLIQKRLAKRLAPQGILLCGVAETLGNDLGVLELAENQGIFYFHRPATTPPAALSPPPLTLVAQSHEEACAQTDASTPASACAGEALTPASPAEAALEETLGQRVHAAHAHLDQSRFNDAETLLSALLSEHPRSVDALLLAGLAARWQRKARKAYDYFERALSIAPECWPAHFYQAELFRLEELPPGSEPLGLGYETALRLLAANPRSSGGLTFLCSPIPPGDAAFLAKCYLAQCNLAKSDLASDTLERARHGP